MPSHHGFFQQQISVDMLCFDLALYSPFLCFLLDACLIKSRINTYIVARKNETLVSVKSGYVSKLVWEMVNVINNRSI